MIPSAERSFLESLEHSLAAGTAEVPEVSLALIAGRGVRVDQAAVRGAARRAVQLLAAGGDPYRGLDPNGRAVVAVAADLDDAHRRLELSSALSTVLETAAGLPLVTSVVARLVGDPDLAWRWFACTLLAEELAGDEHGLA